MTKRNLFEEIMDGFNYLERTRLEETMNDENKALKARIVLLEKHIKNLEDELNRVRQYNRISNSGGSDE